MKVYICVAGRAHGWPEAGVPDRAHHQAGGVGPPLPRLPAPGPQAEIRPDEGGPAATAAAGGAARATTATATEDQLSGSGQLTGGRTRHCFLQQFSSLSLSLGLTLSSVQCGFIAFRLCGYPDTRGPN